MKLPEKIKGINKIRDSKICYDWSETLLTFPELVEKYKLTERRIRQILVTNHAFISIDKEWEKKKRIHAIKLSIKKSKESSKDRADLIDQLRKEIEGDKPLIDNSKHYHFSATNLQSARERVLSGTN